MVGYGKFVRIRTDSIMEVLNNMGDDFPSDNKEFISKLLNEINTAVNSNSIALETLRKKLDNIAEVLLQ